MNRRRFPKEIETRVFVACRRRCALCFGLSGDTTEKEGQVAHIDRDRSNATYENAAWLCTIHHARYDSRSTQTKGHTPGELKAFQALLIQYLASPSSWPDAGRQHTHGQGVTLDVFDRRVPTYRTTIQFIRAMLDGGRKDLRVLLQFAADTDEALFLFDDQIADYLRLLYKQAIRLNTICSIIEAPERRTPELTQEDMELMLWFSQQFDEARRRFAPYLQVGRALADNQTQPTRSAKARRRGPRR